MTGIIDLVNEAAGSWSSYMLWALVEGTIALLIAGVLWLVLRRWVSSHVGYALFLLVLVKLAVPVEVSVPPSMAWLSPGTMLRRTATEELPPVPTREELLFMLTAPPVAEEPVGAAPASAPSALDLASWLMLGWGTLVLFGIVRFAVKQRRTRRMLENAVRIREDAVMPGFGRLRRAAGIRRPLDIHVSEAIASPAVCGLRRPVLVIPPDLDERLDQEQLTWVLLHEMAHIRRRDLWLALVQRLVQIAFFFHPAVWLTNRLIDQQREYCCDDDALARASASRKACGRGFLSIVESAVGAGAAPGAALGILDDKTLVRRRLMRILDRNRRVRKGLSVASALLIVASALLVLPTVRAAVDDDDEERARRRAEIRAKMQSLENELQMLRIQDQALDIEAKAAKVRRALERTKSEKTRARLEAELAELMDYLAQVKASAGMKRRATARERDRADARSAEVALERAIADRSRLMQDLQDRRAVAEALAESEARARQELSNRLAENERALAERDAMLADLRAMQDHLRKNEGAVEKLEKARREYERVQEMQQDADRYKALEKEWQDRYRQLEERRKDEQKERYYQELQKSKEALERSRHYIEQSKRGSKAEQQQSRYEDVQKLYRDVEEWMKRGDHARAEAGYERLRRLDPNDEKRAHHWRTLHEKAAKEKRGKDAERWMNLIQRENDRLDKAKMKRYILEQPRARADAETRLQDAKNRLIQLERMIADREAQAEKMRAEAENRSVEADRRALEKAEKNKQRDRDRKDSNKKRLKL